MKDSLGDRIKSNYEDRAKTFLPRRTYTIIRLDGKSFHTYTKGLKKPFDYDLIEDLDNAIIAMMSEIQGAVFAYTQSDEISILLTDFQNENTDAWFDGNIQKMVSVSASLMTAHFNNYRYSRFLQKRNGLSAFNDFLNKNLAFFDSRVFTIPDRTEVMNYFIWRNQDCARNSLSMVAQSLYSHKELQNKNSSELQELIFKKEINWSDYRDDLKNGRIIVKESYRMDNLCGEINVLNGLPADPIIRTKWVSQKAWKFTQNKEALMKLIPDYS